MDMEFGIRIWIFTAGTGGYPQAFRNYLYPYPYPLPGLISSIKEFKYYFQAWKGDEIFHRERLRIVMED